ncbi:ABC transporter substrate-binding protein [Clostridium luticellarii]|jgi:ABC-type nitrate/sulfonate/bicarbonate transport system substrate-binding protein|uniref:Putative aliphatic sulfonates-binding protein n=1 Tax=Clostridium luticellarii TaxID=1691940 RepID=A0A2T0BND7_9CLOT|nr:ABC transporter substrate-binding protein [Clostridium luticellarii]MCI1945383.1 ABC transporter substrate-binding protein [Clostridium luticellarii]MCI1968718.1 ABC transporter substrate-binding protein [Clostridium luticellarii]MCI1994927.1 ABC transporter substrate-binding protein [Clostridium luticellarii]MCI2040144.1 ABC transporter substrate-binding protein [Clostridium luticellarii]PRR85390.1 putative aliphatic sulfonates-binding protein precursor [Clostridium luticellarii]
MKKVFIALLALVMALGAVGCSGESSSENKTSSGQKSSSKEIVIKYPNTQWYDAVYIADAKGYFKEQGIKIKYVGEIPSAQIVPSVASGSIDFGLRHVPLIAMANAQGSKLKIVAGGTQTLEKYPHMRYIVRKDSGINSLKDIAGKKVAINSFGACSEFVTREFLREQNLDPNNVNFVVLPDSQQEQAVENKLIDIAIVHAPYTQKALNNPNLKQLTTDYALEKGVSGMCPYFTNESFAEKNPEAVKGFVTAVAKASDWSKTHESEGKEIIAKKLGIKASDVEAWNYYPQQVVQKDAVKWWLDYLEKNGKLKAGQVKLDDIYTNEYNPNSKS